MIKPDNHDHFKKLLFARLGSRANWQSLQTCTYKNVKMTALQYAIVQILRKTTPLKLNLLTKMLNNKNFKSATLNVVRDNITELEELGFSLKVDCRKIDDKCSVIVSYAPTEDNV